MKLTDIGNERENCISGRTSAWFRSLTRDEQELVKGAYRIKIRSLEQPVSETDKLITRVEYGISDPYQGYPRRDVK